MIYCPDPDCDGVIESSSKVYIDITKGDINSDGTVLITDMEFSALNDTFKGHPYNFEGELYVGCSDCGAEFVPRFEFEGNDIEPMRR